MTRLEREWAARLAASGFQDLEGRDRDGPLSDRGNLHVVTEGDGQRERLAERIEHGSAYHTWALDVLRTHRFASQLERDVWACEVDGIGIKGAMRALGITFHRARTTMLAVKAAVESQQVRRVRRQACEKAKLRQLIRRSDPTLLAKLAAVLLRARPA